MANETNKNAPINQIIVGDSLLVLKSLCNNSVDLTITSPPYYQQRDYNNGINGIGNEDSIEEYIDNILKVFFECVRVTKDTGTVVFNLGDKYLDNGLTMLPYKFAIKAIESKKVFLVNQLVWHKLNPTPRQDKRKLIPSTEPFFIFAKSKNYHFDLDSYLDYSCESQTKKKVTNKLGKKYFDLIEKSDLTEVQKENAKQALKEAILSVHNGEIDSFRMKIKGIHKEAYGGMSGGRNNQIRHDGFTIIRITGNKLKKDLIESPVEITKDNPHPAVYPLYIIQELIKLLSKQNDLVLDPFCGSGTTCLAAKNLKRNYLGIEINPLYVKLANERLLKADFGQELFL